ncbi:MAG: HPr family phosphocarrier protein [Lachnospiraceae bacterium]|nr:HPr family phosphocarrier protein [Lachnospiraceae bacterium]
MKKETVVVKLTNGLEARPVALLVQEASRFDSKIYIESGTKKVNAKSIMGMMTLGLNNGEELEVCCEGEDEEDAIESICGFLENTVKEK